MCVLGIIARLVNSGLGGSIAFTVLFADILLGGFGCLIRDSKRVGTHIGYKTVSSAMLRTQINSFVKLLGYTHSVLGLEAKLL